MREDPSGVQVGDRFHREHRFTPAEVAAFSLAAGDDNPLHLDAEHARASPYGGLIVSGTHTTALLLGLTASYFSKRTHVVGRRFSVCFRRAVNADASVVIEWRVVGLRPRARAAGRVVQLDGELRDVASGEVCVQATGEVVIGV